MSAAPEVWFYHLQRQPLERALPALLERARANGWTAVVQASAPERVAALDDLLWTYSDDSFLAHGAARDGEGADQPIWLTSGADNPNACAVRLFVDGADVEAALADLAAAPSARAIVLFDGNDEAALDQARAQFRALRTKGFVLSYWRQNDQGRWEKMA